jgi:hypothetical protein
MGMRGEENHCLTGATEVQGVAGGEAAGCDDGCCGAGKRLGAWGDKRTMSDPKVG